MHPHARPPANVRRFRSRDFVLGMRAKEIAPPAVNVERLAEIFRAHRGALDVPARSPLPPRAVPGGLAGLARLPQSKIHRRFFPLVDLHARARFELVDILSRKFAVAGK